MADALGWGKPWLQRERSACFNLNVVLRLLVAIALDAGCAWAIAFVVYAAASGCTALGELASCLEANGEKYVLFLVAAGLMAAPIVLLVVSFTVFKKQAGAVWAKVDANYWDLVAKLVRGACTGQCVKSGDAAPKFCGRPLGWGEPWLKEKHASVKKCGAMLFVVLFWIYACCIGALAWLATGCFHGHSCKTWWHIFLVIVPGVVVPVVVLFASKVWFNTDLLATAILPVYWDSVAAVVLGITKCTSKTGEKLDIHFVDPNAIARREALAEKSTHAVGETIDFLMGSWVPSFTVCDCGVPLVALLEVVALSVNLAEQIGLAFVGEVAQNAQFGVETPHLDESDPSNMHIMWLSVTFGLVLGADDAKCVILDYLPDKWPLVEYAVTVAISVSQIAFLPIFAPNMSLPLWYWYAILPLEIANEVMLIVLARLEYPAVGSTTFCCCQEAEAQKGRRPQLRDRVTLVASEADYWRAQVPDMSIDSSADLVVVKDDRSAAPFKLSVLSDGSALPGYFKESWVTLVARSESSGVTNEHVLTKAIKALDTDGDGCISPCELINGLKKTPVLFHFWVEGHVKMLARTTRTIFYIVFFTFPSFIRPPWMLSSLHFTLALCVWMAVFDLKRMWYQSVWINLCFAWLETKLCAQKATAEARCETQFWCLYSARRLDKIKALKARKNLSFLSLPLQIVHFVFDVVIVHGDAIMAVSIFAIIASFDTPPIASAVLGGKIGGAFAPMPWCEPEDGADPCPADARYWSHDWELGWMITILIISILTVLTLGHPIPMALDLIKHLFCKSLKISFWRAARDNTMLDTSAGSWKASLTPRERRASLQQFAAPSLRLDAADLPDGDVPMMPMLKVPAGAGATNGGSGDDAAEFAQLASMRDTGALTEEEYTVAVQKVAEGSCAGAYDATSIPVVQTGVVVGVVPPAIRRVTPLRSNIYSGFSSDV